MRNCGLWACCNTKVCTRKWDQPEFIFNMFAMNTVPFAIHCECIRVCSCVSSQPVCGGLSLLLSCSVIASRLVWFSAISCSSLTSAPVFWTPSGTYNTSTQRNAIQSIHGVPSCYQQCKHVRHRCSWTDLRPKASRGNALQCTESQHSSNQQKFTYTLNAYKTHRTRFLPNSFRLFSSQITLMRHLTLSYLKFNLFHLFISTNSA